MKNKYARFIIMGFALILALAGCSSAPKNEPPPPAPPPAPPPPPSFVIKDVNFAFDSDQLDPSAFVILDRAVTALKQQPDVPYRVAGFTDSIGSERYNQGLSERRAGSVSSYLVQQGVSSRQLTVRGYGETRPIASNQTPEGRAENRRVEIRPNQ